MPLNRQTVMFLATLAAAAGLVIWVIMRTDDRVAAGAGPASWQHADTPQANDGTVADPWLLPPDAWLDAATPLVNAINQVVVADGDPSSEVVAAADGVVLFAGLRDGAHAVLLGHRDGSGARFESIYAPLAGISVKTGDLVGRGMVVGQLGDEPLGTIIPDPPDGIKSLDDGRSPLADALETPDPDPWMWLEIDNAGKFLDLMETPED